MNNKNNSKPDLIDIRLAAIPLPIEGKVGSHTVPVPWGANNDYPNFLLSLYGKVPIFANIINQKAVHIFGDGIFDKVTNKPFEIKPNSDDTLELFIDKLLKSFLIFNAFAVEVNFLPDGTPASYYHLPMERIALNDTKDMVFYYGDNNKTKVTATFERYNPGIVYSEHKSKVYYYEGYVPNNTKVYPTPDYYPLIKTLLTDVAITDFNFNQISNHFSPSTMISFFNGEPDDDIKARVLRDLKASYTGENGKKLLVDYNNPNGKGAEIKNLSVGDWHDAYSTIKASVESIIYLGSGITNSAIFGDKTAGQLGNTQELANSYEIWSNSYLRKVRNELEAPLNELFKANIFFKNKPLFSTSLSEDLKKSIYTINEMRKEQGLPPLSSGDRLLSEPAPAPASFAEHKCESHANRRVLTEDDYAEVEKLNLGVNEDDYEIFEESEFSLQMKFDDEADIVNYILDNDINDFTAAELRARIKKDLGIELTTKGVKDLMNKLTNVGVANAVLKDGVYNLKPTPKRNTPYTNRTVLTMFKYSKRPEVKGADLLPTSRGFCIKLMESKKLYSREDIQALSALFEYDIMTHTGGYYTNPETGVTTNYCRHYWKQVSVAKK